MNRDVHNGYLEFTQAGIITQAFKCLGNRYGWGGMLKSPVIAAEDITNIVIYPLDIKKIKKLFVKSD